LAHERNNGNSRKSFRRRSNDKAFGRSLSRVAIAAALLLPTAIRLGAQPIETPPLRLETKILLGDVKGRIDHMAINPIRNRLFVAELGNDSVGIVDLAVGKVIHRIAGGDFPMALDEMARRIFVAFRAPAKLGAFSVADGQSVKRVDLCGDADDLFLDAKRQRAYVSCGEGFIDAFDTGDAEYRRLARIPTVPGARTAYFEPSTDRLFLAVRATSSEPAAIWVFRAGP
jgi:hypothetical protein